MANVSFPILSYITFVPLIGVVILLFLNRETFGTAALGSYYSHAGGFCAQSGDVCLV